MTEIITIEKCPRCWEKHDYKIEDKWIKEWLTINLACQNIQRYARISNFHFGWFGKNFDSSKHPNIEKQLALEYGEINLSQKISKLKNIQVFMLITDEYTQYFEEIKNAYIMWYTYPFMTSCVCLLERILNVMIHKLKWYYQKTNEYKKIVEYKEEQKKKYKIETESISNWKLMINSLYERWVINDLQKDLFENFRNYRNKIVHFNQDYAFLEQSDKIMKEFTNLIRSLFDIFERRDIIEPVPWEFRIKPDMMENPFVNEFFVPNSRMSSYIGNIFDDVYCEEWVKPWKIEPAEFFKLRTEFWKKHREKPKIELSPIKIYWKNMFCRVI